jgi:hypothetical protein
VPLLAEAKGVNAMTANGYATTADRTPQITHVCSPHGLAIAGELDELSYADLLAALTTASLPTAARA